MSLFKAIKNNNFILLEQLLQKPDNDINQLDNTYKCTPLYYGVRYNRVEMVRLLLEHKA